MAKYPQLNIRVDDEVLSMIDDFRRTQHDIPNRPEAARRLIRDGARKSRESATIHVLSGAILKVCGAVTDKLALSRIEEDIRNLPGGDRMMEEILSTAHHSGMLGVCAALAEWIEDITTDI